MWARNTRNFPAEATTTLSANRDQFPSFSRYLVISYADADEGDNPQPHNLTLVRHPSLQEEEMDSIFLQTVQGKESWVADYAKLYQRV